MFKPTNSGRDGEDEEDDGRFVGSKWRGNGGGVRKAKIAKEQATVRQKERVERDATPPMPGAPALRRGEAAVEEAQEEVREQDDDDDVGVTLEWPPAMPVSVCLRAISGHSADILRIFDFLESYAVINPAVDVEQDVGGVWTESDLVLLFAAVREHGADWSVVAAQLGRADSPHECAVVMAAMAVRGSPLQRLASLHAGRLMRASAQPVAGQEDGHDSSRLSQAKSAAILGQASVVHRGIGLHAAAAAVDAVLLHSLAEKAETDKSLCGAQRPMNGGRGGGSNGTTNGMHTADAEVRTMTESEMQHIQEKACKASILAKLALRSSLLARRETLDMRRLMAQAVELQLERIQRKKYFGCIQSKN